jgi:Tfp pilus assembly protein PilO
VNMPNKNAGVVLTIVLGGAALAYTFLIFVPGQRSLASVREEIQSRQLYILDTTQVVTELTQVEQQLEAAGGYAQQQQEILPASAELSQYTAELTTCATEAKVRIVRFSPQFPQSMPPLSRVPVFVSVEGELPRVFDFAARVEGLPVPIWCQQFTVESETKEPGFVRAEFELLIFASNLEKSD